MKNEDRMDPTIKSRWIRALISDEYIQGKGQLREGNSFCCLGVLCDIYDKNRWMNDSYVYTEGLQRAFPPNDVQNAAWLSDKAGSTLASMNDNGASFSTIARYIEENL